MDKVFLEHIDCEFAAERLWEAFSATFRRGSSPVKVYGVPRGGIPVLYLLKSLGARTIANAYYADLIVDDIIDSGRTRDLYHSRYPNIPFLALADHIEPKQPKGRWLVFPWEQGEEGKDTSADDIVIRLLQRIGEDPTREGLRETPARVLKAWDEWTSGYKVKPDDVLKTFSDGAEKYDEMIVERELPFYSHCEHHLAPFFGTATIAYIPDGRIVGLSKIGRVLEIFARRLQVQERMTTQIADAIQKNLGPKGVGVILKARHLCMESRGYNKQGHLTITSALRGIFLDNSSVRQEFLAIAK